MEPKVNGFEQYCCQVKISGYLDESWATWLDCTSIICEETRDSQIPVTILTFPVTDQAALRGLLNRFFDLNLTILSIYICNSDTDTDKIPEITE